MELTFSFGQTFGTRLSKIDEGTKILLRSLFVTWLSKLLLAVLRKLWKIEVQFAIIEMSPKLVCLVHVSVLWVVTLWVTWFFESTLVNTLSPSWHCGWPV